MNNVAQALQWGTLQGGIPGNPFNTNNKLGDILNGLVPYLLGAAGLVLLLYLIYGGFQLMTSGGDPAKMKEAQAIVTHAIAGFVIVFMAYWVLQIVETIFGIQSGQRIFP